ncbi:MAG: hypothetical protein J0I12_34855 [Candidatus Eremiobacteraeota bacterium]|nr:hypothetical protein [Candidatus Eremiobacteraeota bacterium]
MWKNVILAFAFLTASVQAKGPVETVHFARGTTGTVLQGAVLRGEINTYILGAARGQTITVSISSVENNAYFDLVNPSGNLMQQEAQSANMRLPANGNYRLLIGSSRGNATYKVKVTIK